MITGDSTSLFRKAYLSPEGKGFSSIGGRDGFLLALLKYPFYPLFNFDNGMNLISESLIILTSAQLLVVFAFAHIFWRYFVFAGFLPILEHEMARPTIMR